MRANWNHTSQCTNSISNAPSILTFTIAQSSFNSKVCVTSSLLPLICCKCSLNFPCASNNMKLFKNSIHNMYTDNNGAITLSSFNPQTNSASNFTLLLMYDTLYEVMVCLATVSDTALPLNVSEFLPECGHCHVCFRTQGI